MCNRNRNDSIGRLDECHSLLRQLVDKHFCWISGWRLTGKKCWCEHKTEIQVSVTFNVTQWHESMRQIPLYDWQIRCDDRVTCVALSFLMFRYAQRWMESFSSSQRAYQNTIQTGNAPTTTCKYVLFFKLLRITTCSPFCWTVFFLLDSVSWKLVYIQSWRQQSACVTQIRGNVVFSLFFRVPTRAGESRARSLFTGSVFIFIITCDRCSCSHLTKNCFVFTFSVERPSPAEADPNLKKYNPPLPPHLLWACPDAPQWDLTPHRTGLQEASNSPPALPASHVQTFVLFLFVFFYSYLVE